MGLQKQFDFLLLENNSVHWVAKQKQFISDHYRVENFKIKVPGDWFSVEVCTANWYLRAVSLQDGGRETFVLVSCKHHSCMHLVSLARFHPKISSYQTFKFITQV